MHTGVHSWIITDFVCRYNDDEAPKPPPPTAAAPVPAVSAPATTMETKVITPVIEEANGEASPGGAFDQDDEDGDVDFDLGEPETISSPPPPPPQPQRHDIPESPPSTSGAMMKAGSTKEDGYVNLFLLSFLVSVFVCVNRLFVIFACGHIPPPHSAAVGKAQCGKRIAQSRIVWWKGAIITLLRVVNGQMGLLDRTQTRVVWVSGGVRPQSAPVSRSA